MESAGAAGTVDSPWTTPCVAHVLPTAPWTTAGRLPTAPWTAGPTDHLPTLPTAMMMMERTKITRRI